MVFYCDAAECLSHKAKLRHPEKHPWMKEVIWVKWPRGNVKAEARLKRLIRGGGKSTDKNGIDKLICERSVRASRGHFRNDE